MVIAQSSLLLDFETRDKFYYKSERRLIIPSSLVNKQLNFGLTAGLSTRNILYFTLL